MNRRTCYALLAASLLGALVIVPRLVGRTPGGEIASLKTSAGDVRYRRLVPEGDRLQGGVYDPSVAYTADGKVGWLAYSSVTGAHKPIGEYVHTHLARSTDRGLSWRFVRALGEPAPGQITTPGGVVTGAWRDEVPTLVHDPTDPDEAARWKLFVHEYFWSEAQDRMISYGWIAMRTAADPAGEWSQPLPLFGADASPVPPYDKTRVDLNRLDPSLKNAAAYSEPGAMAVDGRLYLAMTALLPRVGLGGVGVDHVVFLIASDDHAATWRFVATLLTPGDAHRLGCDSFDGSSLAIEDGRAFLLAAPMMSGRPETHHGTAAFEFESLARGRLMRDAGGGPAIAAYFAPQPSIFSGPGGGQAAYDPHNTGGGLIMSQFNLGAYPETFELFQTGRRIVRRE